MSTPEEGLAKGKPYCPSAQPDWNGSFIFGVIRGTADDPRMTPTSELLSPTVDLLSLAKGLLPTEVFRFAAPCAQSGCQHFQSGRCHLVEKVVTTLPAVTDDLPFCQIRSNCRWFLQEGKEACFRCPQIVTDRPSTSPVLRQIADP